MSDQGDQKQSQPSQEPSGLGAHRHGPAAENAQEQGWDINEQERAEFARERSSSGGTDYDYGAADFGDTPTDEHQVQPSPEATEFLTGKKEPDSSAPGPQTSDMVGQ